MSTVTVLITSYNESEYIDEAIESVVSQTVRPEEVLILDDASSDGTEDIIWRYADKYPDLIEAYFHDKNIGVTQNRNFGLRKASGNYITFLDGDNIFLPRKIELEKEILDNRPEIGLAFSDFYSISQDGEILRQWCDSETPPTGDVYEQVLTRDWPSRGLFSHPMIKRTLFDIVGIYDEHLDVYEDWDIFIRLSKETNVEYTGLPLVKYRQHPGSLSSEMSAVDALDAYTYILNKYISEHAGTNIQEKMKSLIDNKKGEMYYEKGDRTMAFKYFVESILRNPSLLTKQDIKYVLPKPLFRLLRRVSVPHKASPVSPT